MSRNLAWVLVSLLGATGCRSPEAPAPSVPGAAQVRYTTARLSQRWEPLEVDPASETFRALMPTAARRARAPSSAPRAQARHNLWSNPSRVAELTQPLGPVTLATDGGAAAAALIAALPPERRALGLQGLTPQALYGDDGIGNCEAVAVETTHQFQGATYEARYRFDLGHVMTKPQAMLYALSSTCTAALAAAGRNPTLAIGNGCTREDEVSHFGQGSTCRTCLNADGDHARCVAEQRCPAQTARTMTAVEGGSPRYFDVLRSTELACAPDHVVERIFLARDLGPGDPTPAPFDHTKYVRSCIFFWSLGANDRVMYCSQEQAEIRMTTTDVLIGRVDHIRLPGETRQPLFHRTMFARGLEVDGVAYEAMSLHPGSLAELSEIDIRTGGYGLNPNTLRADAAEPIDVNDYRARDWLATMAVKTTTNLNNVPFVLYNHNTCPVGGWQGPDAKGRYFCKPGFFDDETNPNPENYEWQYDYGAFFTGFDPDRVEMLPTVTLGATGLIDETIPGGLVPRILGTSVLADPEWEACAWPEQFEPDEVAGRDLLEPGTYTFTAQTYRFGKDPRLDLRVVLATSWRRHFCPEPL